MARIDLQILEDEAMRWQGELGSEPEMQAVLRLLREKQEEAGEDLKIEDMCRSLGILSKTAQLVAERLRKKKKDATALASIGIDIVHLRPRR